MSYFTKLQLKNPTTIKTNGAILKYRIAPLYFVRNKIYRCTENFPEEIIIPFSFFKTYPYNPTGKSATETERLL